MKKIFLITISLFLSVKLIAEIIPYSLEDRVQNADTVVSGKIVDVDILETYPHERHSDIQISRAIAKLKIYDVFKGKYTKPYINIEYEYWSHLIEDPPVTLEKDADVIVFLRKDSASNYYRMITAYHGKMNLSNENIKKIKFLTRRPAFTSDNHKYNWKDLTPMKLLEYLKKSKGSQLTVMPAPNDWIKKEDIQKLIGLIESNIQCPHVVPATSSYYVKTNSTIGDEAIFMIDGFIEGRYPPEQYAKPRTKEKVKDIKEWYKSWQENLKPTERK